MKFSSNTYKRKPLLKGQGLQSSKPVVCTCGVSRVDRWNLCQFRKLLFCYMFPEENV